ncbi:acyl-CoA dehydrogenase [Spongiibacter sp. KMU-166]|uniref:Acyl-CoA dehydrogenase n=2 Tax=Spongiibacter thalassae TaxID=2721624 RepID=A0ABX1G9R8_9GAMM|nr:acyl-CoA dehydrogenase family protein [Spongiibacter thalassae]NKI15902.1 acyl-CoA dehydrogenase [Spongiibacter thalassae]
MATELERFRDEVREWLELNCPASMRTPMVDSEIPWGGRNAKFPNPDTKLWLDRMIEKGWTVPTWPEQYGGAGLSIEQAQVLEQEMEKINARTPLFSMGIFMLGPVLLELGTEEQKQRFLPDIARGKRRWCQGYSEPGAGSDLASLSTKAELRGDHYLINGSKIWNSEADQSDWIFCLVRTDFDAPKHKGISFLLFDLDSPGVDRQPIKLISGSSVFCQTFFDDVKVPAENLVGEENAGWSIAKRLLQYERQNVGKHLNKSFDIKLWDLAKKYSSSADGQIEPDLRSRIARQAIQDGALGLLIERLEREADNPNAGSMSSVMKVAMADINLQRGELAIEAMGAAGLGWQGDEFPEEALGEVRVWLRGKANSIEGGTSEVNLNIIAKRILGLPDPQH